MAPSTLSDDGSDWSNDQIYGYKFVSVSMISCTNVLDLETETAVAVTAGVSIQILIA